MIRWWLGDWFRWSAVIGALIAGMWLYLRISGLRRAEPGWLDRLGRILGACWVAFFLLYFWFYMDQPYNPWPSYP